MLRRTFLQGLGAAIGATKLPALPVSSLVTNPCVEIPSAENKASFLCTAQTTFFRDMHNRVWCHEKWKIAPTWKTTFPTRYIDIFEVDKKWFFLRPELRNWSNIPFRPLQLLEWHAFNRNCDCMVNEKNKDFG